MRSVYNKVRTTIIFSFYWTTTPHLNLPSHREKRKWIRKYLREIMKNDFLLLRALAKMLDMIGMHVIFYEHSGSRWTTLSKYKFKFIMINVKLILRVFYPLISPAPIDYGDLVYQLIMSLAKCIYSRSNSYFHWRRVYLIMLPTFVYI